ncbi:hypothetical protein TWF281_005148 [Arthrobotrys megalospora]
MASEPRRGGRRKQVVKSDLFETTCRQQGLFLNLAPEVLLNILSYCSRNDLLHIVQTCKDFYNVAYPLLWSTIRLYPVNYPSYRPPGPRSNWSRARASLNYESLVKLTEITRAERAKKNRLGYKYIRTLTLSGEGQELGRVVPRHWKGLLDVLAILEGWLKSGEMNVKHLEFVIDVTELEHPELGRFQRFIQAVKRYSETKSQNQLSVKLDYACNRSKEIRIMPDYFDYSNLTDLTLKFLNCWRVDISNFGNSEWDNSARWTIVEQTNLLSAATNLRHLSLIAEKPSENGGQETLEPVPAPLDVLQKLQTALSGLRRLSTLHVNGFLWDPSFFPIPPPAVKTFKYTDVHTVSREWWRQFATCDFLSVESMTIEYPLGAAQRRVDWWRGVQDGMNTKDHGGYDGLQHWKFEIKNVAVTGLKEFVYQDRRDYLAPIDLVDCMVRNNRGIREEWREALLERYGRVLLVESNARLIGPLRETGIMQAMELAIERFADRYLDGENEQDEEEEIRLFTIEYAKEIVKWLEKNMEARAAGN